MDKWTQLLAALNEADREKLRAFLETTPEWVKNEFMLVSLPKDTEFVRETEPVDSVYVLVEGMVKAADYRVIEVEYDFSWFYPIMVFGAMEYLMDLQSYKASLLTVTPCRLLRLSMEQFSRWMERDFTALRKQAKDMSDYLLGRIELERLFMFSNGDDRIALFLKSFYEKQALSGSCAIPLTRDDLAHTTGLSTRTVSRTITSFLEKGMLSRNGWKITISEEQCRKLTEFVSNRIDIPKK